jgi:hypothetical protein
MERFMPTGADPLGFDAVKSHFDRSQLSFGNVSPGQSEQHIVLFIDVIGQEGDVVYRVTVEGSQRSCVSIPIPDGGRLHPGNKITALLMLPEHHPHRPTLTADAHCFQSREEQLLLFAMVAPVDKDGEKVEELLDMLQVYWIFSSVCPFGDTFKYFQRRSNRLVLCDEFIDGIHWEPPLRQAD